MIAIINYEIGLTDRPPRGPIGPPQAEDLHSQDNRGVPVGLLLHVPEHLSLRHPARIEIAAQGIDQQLGGLLAADGPIPGLPPSQRHRLHTLLHPQTQERSARE